MKLQRRTPKGETEAGSEAVAEKKENTHPSRILVKIILTALFAVLSVFYWVIFYLWEFRNKNNDFSISSLGEFLIPVIAIIAIVSLISHIRRKRDTKRNYIILAVYVLVLICSIGYIFYFAHDVCISGFSPIYDTVEENGKYYIVLNHEYEGKDYLTRLRCDKEIYDNVIVDEKVNYSYQYMWITLTPKTGYLFNFDLVDYCDNRNNWMESYFKERSKNELSKAQLNIIKGSATVVSNVAEDAGVKITLDSAIGNGYYSYYKLDVVLPEGTNAGEGLTFEKFRLMFNDDNTGLGSGGGSSTMTVDDGNTTDNRFSILIGLHYDKYPSSPDYAFNNGIVRTLHLENIKDSDNVGKDVNLIEGTWDFDILFNDEGKQVELIDKPITVSGYSHWDKTPFKAEITSFVVSEFSINCQYKLTPKSESRLMEIYPIAVMKDGREFRVDGGGSSNTCFSYSFAIPVSLDEIDYIKLTDDVILKMK